MCDSVTVLDEWRAGATTAPLWPFASVPDTLVATIASRVGEYADVVHRMGTAVAVDTGVDDPWFDQSYPQRVLARMVDLLADGDELTPVEAGFGAGQHGPQLVDGLGAGLG